MFGRNENIIDDYSTIIYAGTVAISIGLGVSAYYYKKTAAKIAEITAKSDANQYDDWKSSFKNVKLPAAFVDLDAFDGNLEKLVKIVKKNNQHSNQKPKTIRIATKSLRSPELIQRALKNGGGLMQGVMSYCVDEAWFLATKYQIKDILIAYPTVNEADLINLRMLHVAGHNVKLVVDCVEHLHAISKAMAGVRQPFQVVIELDPSIDLGFLHIGAERSPIRTLAQLQQLLHASKNFTSIKVIGVMAYESAVAAITDANPNYNFFWNSTYKAVRSVSAFYAARIRAGVPGVFAAEGITLELFNGGGTGSIDTASAEKSGLTEVTFGSGLLKPHLFDYCSNLTKVGLEPAIYFAIPVSRKSADGKRITCFEGGYIASGQAGNDRFPVAVMPVGLVATKDEGYGEVQTPLFVTKNNAPEIGEPVFCRPAKAGDLASRFNVYHAFTQQTFFGVVTPEMDSTLIESKLQSEEFEVVEMKTYRGLGTGF